MCGECDIRVHNVKKRKKHNRESRSTLGVRNVPPLKINASPFEFKKKDVEEVKVTKAGSARGHKDSAAQQAYFPKNEAKVKGTVIYSDARLPPSGRRNLSGGTYATPQKYK
jgi:hypothetical protein